MNNSLYTPTDGEEELLMLAGRVNALAEYVNSAKCIDRKTIAAIIGIKLTLEAEED